MILEDLKKHQLIQRLHEMHLPLQYFCQKFLKLMLEKQDDEYSRKVPIEYCSENISTLFETLTKSAENKIPN